MSSGMDAVYFDKNGKAARQENTNKRGITFIRDERGRLEKAETDTEASLSMHMTVKACSWKSQTMWAER